MQLIDLNKYDIITIQAHDNPDADAIASGFALYTYFKEQGKQVSLIYSGRYQIQKTDLKLMIEKLNIPITYYSMNDSKIDGLLITVDCQHGAGNVHSFMADEVVVIDHHQQEISLNKLAGYEIASNLGSCATLVWRMLLDAGYDINENIQVGTALYYGLFRDTNQFTELYYPLDLDMRESVSVDKSIINLLKNSNLSLKELEIAGIALIRYIYNSDFHYAIIQTQPCDPNLLGLISDFLIQVDEIYTCVVFNHLEDGYKYSVRSCVKEVKASELAQFLAKDVGSGGGHFERAGGFLSERRYNKYYPVVHAEAYFSNKMNQYFESFDIVDTSVNDIDTSEMSLYERKHVFYSYVKISDVLTVGTQCFVRTLEGDTKLIVNEHDYILVDDNCGIKVVTKEYFAENLKDFEGVYDIDSEYTPKIKIKDTNEYVDLMQHTRLCTNKKCIQVLAKQLVHGVKIFTPKLKDSYIVGNQGDYIVVNCDDKTEISIIEQNLFQKLYRQK